MDEMELTLMEALDLLEQGLSVDEIVARFPAHAAELHPFLMTAEALPALAAQPSVAAQRRSQANFLAEAERRAAQPRRAVAAGGWLRRLALPLMAVLLAVIVGGAGLAGASGSAVPGDALYGTKRLVETARLSLATDAERAAALREQFRQERVREIEALLADGREAEVELVGPVEAIDGPRWQVAGVGVDVAGAIIDGLADLGATVRVEGRTADDLVAADRVFVLVSAAPQPTPDTTPVVTPNATPPSPTPAATPTSDDDDNTPMSAPGSQPISPPAASPTFAAQTAEPTAAPPPPPTATPDDDDDDDGDDDGDDNGDDDGNGGDDDGDDSNDDDDNRDDDSGDDDGDDDSSDDDGDEDSGGDDDD